MKRSSKCIKHVNAAYVGIYATESCDYEHNLVSMDVRCSNWDLIPHALRRNPEVNGTEGTVRKTSKILN